MASLFDGRAFPRPVPLVVEKGGGGGEMKIKLGTRVDSAIPRST